MNKITKEEIEKLAKLARLGLTEAEKAALTSDMTAILDYVKQLDEVNVDGIVATSQVTGLTNVTREDEIVRSEINREQLLGNAPDTEKGFIKVKSVL